VVHGLQVGLETVVVHHRLEITRELLISGLGMRWNAQDALGVLFEFLETQHLVFEYQILIFVATEEGRSLHLPGMNEVAQLAASGQLKEAVEVLKKNPTYDATYFYNLGVLHGRMEQAGLAVAYLEKANREKPHDPEIQNSLRVAREALRQTLIRNGSEGTVDGCSTPLEGFADRIRGEEILGVIGLITLSVSLLWIRAYLKTRNLTKTLLKPSGWFGALALVLGFAFYGVYQAGSANPPAVMIAKQQLRSGPGMNFPEIGSIEIGVKVRVIGDPATVNQNELWQKIRYRPNQTAWIPLSSLLPL
jgi:hypothetical protein